MGFLVRLFICLLIVSITLYAYINKVNALTELRIRVPELSKKMKLIEEENERLRYEKGTFENPLNLMELARKPAWSHLKHPYIPEIITVDISSGKAVVITNEEKEALHE